MKPDSWKQLPGPLLERLLWDCDLYYCNYESSKAEKVHDILNDDINDENRRVVNTAWKFMSEDSFRLLCEQERDQLKQQLAEIEGFLDIQPPVV